MNSEMLRQPSRFLNSRNKIEMAAFPRTTQFAGNKKNVARLTATPKNTAIFFDRTSDTNGDNHWPSRLARFPSDNCDCEASSRPFQPTIQFDYPIGFPF